MGGNMWHAPLAFRMSITLAICCCCSAGVFLTAAALSSDLANLLGENPPEKKSAFSSGSRRSILSSSRGSKTDEERFAAFQDEASGTRAADPQSGKEASALVDELKNANMPADGSWIEPPRVAYSYPQADYLLIPDTRRYCEGSSILSAKAAKSNAADSRAACSSLPECVFFSASLAKRIGLPLPATFKDGLLPGTGASWLCRGDEWFKGTKAFGWRLLVKGEVLRAASPGFDLHLNTHTGGCEGEDRIREVPRIDSLQHAAKLCQDDAECLFFRIDFGAEADVPNRVRQPKAVFCTGTPSEWEQKSGVVTAMRRGLSAEVEGERVSPGAASACCSTNTRIPHEHSDSS